MRRLLHAAALLLALAGAAWAVSSPAEMLPDPAQEARARALGHELRCMVCQNESIEESGADLARDLRRVVRDRIRAGDSDAQVIDYLHDRYGDFVLLRPPFRLGTLALWGAPVIALGAGLLAIWLLRRRARPAEPPPLSAEEQARLAALTRNETP